MTKADWIAVDWGTSTLRAWAVSGASVVAEAQSDQGMGRLAPEQFEAALLDLIEPWRNGPTSVIACGMVGARQGWVEAPYKPVPYAPGAPDLVLAPARDPDLSVLIVPGVCQTRPPDVMRGEETQIAGYLAKRPAFDGVLCLPGTHTKWAHISAGEIVSFTTVMTGEMFALLRDQSVLRHSVDNAWSDRDFDEAVSVALSRPERLAAELFSIRAAGLVAGQDPGMAIARLSGLLIGAELAATRPYWLGQDVAMIGAPSLTHRYKAALSQQGIVAEDVDGAAMALAGLSAVFSERL